jgi:hypothetical protein
MRLRCSAGTLLRVSITLEGGATIGLSSGSTGSLFTVEDKVTLTLGGNITLQGRSDNNASLVHVDGGALVMKNGSTITGNKATNGGRMYVHSTGWKRNTTADSGVVLNSGTNANWE